MYMMYTLYMRIKPVKGLWLSILRKVSTKVKQLKSSLW